MEHENLNTPQKTPLQQTAVMLSCSKEMLINALKEALIGYEKNIGKYESEYEFIQDDDFEQIAQDLIDFCNWA